MSYANRATASIDRLVSHFGGGATVTVRRHNSLKNRQTDARVVSLLVDGAASSGATTITIDSPNLVGTLRSGTTFTLAGETGTPTHTVSADISAAAGQLTGVTFTPALASDVADDTAVTVTADSADYTFRKMRRGFFERDLQGNLDLTDRKLILSAVGAAVTLDRDDQIIEDDVPLKIKDVRPHKPGGTVAGYVVTVAG